MNLERTSSARIIEMQIAPQAAAPASIPRENRTSSIFSRIADAVSNFFKSFVFLPGSPETTFFITGKYESEYEPTQRHGKRNVTINNNAIKCSYKFNSEKNKTDKFFEKTEVSFKEGKENLKGKESALTKNYSAILKQACRQTSEDGLNSFLQDLKQQHPNENFGAFEKKLREDLAQINPFDNSDGQAGLAKFYAWQEKNESQAAPTTFHNKPLKPECLKGDAGKGLEANVKTLLNEDDKWLKRQKKDGIQNEAIIEILIGLNNTNNEESEKIKERLTIYLDEIFSENLSKLYNPSYNSNWESNLEQDMRNLKFFEALDQYEKADLIEIVKVIKNMITQLHNQGIEITDDLIRKMTMEILEGPFLLTNFDREVNFPERLIGILESEHYIAQNEECGEKVVEQRSIIVAPDLSSQEESDAKAMKLLDRASTAIDQIGQYKPVTLDDLRAIHGAYQYIRDNSQANIPKDLKTKITDFVENIEPHRAKHSMSLADQIFVDLRCGNKNALSASDEQIIEEAVFYATMPAYKDCPLSQALIGLDQFKEATYKIIDAANSSKTRFKKVAECEELITKLNPLQKSELCRQLNLPASTTAYQIADRLYTEKTGLTAHGIRHEAILTPGGAPNTDIRTGFFKN